MKLLITGSRKATHEKDYQKLKTAVLKHYADATEILHGGAVGADTLAEILATEMELPTTVIKPNYNKHGQIAPLIRNTELVEKCDVVLAYFVDSKTGGTLDTAKKARRFKKPIIEILASNQKTLF